MSEESRTDPHKRIDRLEEQIKEREIYLFRALKTLFNDIQDYRAGKREDVNAALLCLSLSPRSLQPRPACVALDTVGR